MTWKPKTNLITICTHTQTHKQTHSLVIVYFLLEDNGVIGSTGDLPPAHRLWGRISSSSLIKTLITLDDLSTCILLPVTTYTHQTRDHM